MGRIKAPTIYSGFVINMIGQNAGARVPMDFSAAQSCVASGTARWEDDPTPVDKTMRAEIDRVEAERAAQAAADAEHYRKLQEAPASVDDILMQSARGVQISAVEHEGGQLLYLSRPLPSVIAISDVLLDGDVQYIAVVSDADMTSESTDAAMNGDIVLEFENALARYREIGRKDGVVFAELKEAVQPEVDIPDDWRDRHFLANIGAAKAIRALGQKDKMTKADAEAVIEEWTKTDDQVRAEGQEGQETNENGRILDGNHLGSGGKDESGEELTAEEIAQRKAGQFVNDDFDA